MGKVPLYTHGRHACTPTEAVSEQDRELRTELGHAHSAVYRVQGGRKHGLSTEQYSVPAYVRSLKNLKDVKITRN